MGRFARGILAWVKVSIMFRELPCERMVRVDVPHEVRWRRDDGEDDELHHRHPVYVDPDLNR